MIAIVVVIVDLDLDLVDVGETLQARLSDQDAGGV